MMENGHCVATIHAEQNAIVQAARTGTRLESLSDEPTSLYVTASPCWPCFRMIANVGVKRIAYGEFYRDDRIFGIAERLGIEMVDLSK